MNDDNKREKENTQIGQKVSRNTKISAYLYKQTIQPLCTAALTNSTPRHKTVTKSIT